nr:hypothetical protein [Tanacetum cinerariifolium]
MLSSSNFFTNSINTLGVFSLISLTASTPKANSRKIIRINNRFNLTNRKTQIHTRVDGKKVIISEASIRRDLQFADEEGVDCLPNSIIIEQLASMCVPTESVGDDAVYKELDGILVRAATTASSLETEQDSGNINKTQSKETHINQVPKELVQVVVPSAKKPWEIPLLKLGLRMYLNFPIIHWSQEKDQEAKKEIKSRTHKLKRLYKVGMTVRVESSRDEQSLGRDASKQGKRIDDIDADEDITLVNVHDDADKEMFDADKNLGGEEVFVEQEVVADKEKIDEVTLAQALVELETSKPKVKGVVIQEPSEYPTTTTTIPKQKSQEKGKGIRERVKKELKANIALIETWDDVQAKINADYQLAERLQAEEQQELTDEEKATLFMQSLEKRRKFFAAKRAEEKSYKTPHKLKRER